MRRYKIRGKVKRMLALMQEEAREDQIVRLKGRPERNLARERAEGGEKPVA